MSSVLVDATLIILWRSIYNQMFFHDEALAVLTQVAMAMQSLIGGLKMIIRSFDILS